MTKILESNLIVPPVFGPISKDAFDIYQTMLGASKFLNKPICSLCIKSKGSVRTHFHGSDFGSCFRQVQLSMLNPKIANQDDNTRNIFLYDGHLHEQAAIELLGKHYKVSHHDEEIIVEKIIQIEDNLSYVIRVCTHPDLLLEYDKGKILIEFKAVKDWAIKNKVDKFIVPEVYYGQCQIYMEALDLEYALLIFKSRHTSQIYPPFVIPRNKSYIEKRFRALALIQHSNSIPEMVPKAYTDKTCDACTFCDFYLTCWGKNNE